MSSHTPCNCGRKRGDHSDLVVVMRNCNFSAFNGYHKTPSDYSAIKCTRPGCMGLWRSKSSYVDLLPDSVTFDASAPNVSDNNLSNSSSCEEAS